MRPPRFALDRRRFLGSLGAAAVLTAGSAPTVADEGHAGPRAPVGIGSTSYTIHARQAGRRFLEPLRFLEFCRDRGAAGIQAPLGILDSAEARPIREAAERWDMYIEGSVSLPRDEGDLDRFRAELRTVRECGGEIARTVCLSGRRYEVFESAAAYREFLARSRRSLELAEPIARGEGVRLAVENHKDRGPGQLAELLGEISSEAVGATVDLGNDIALLETPEETVRLLAPFAVSTHLKDARVAETEDGFWLDDVPLGTGMIDVHALARQLVEANPRLNLTLEMITRDPLRVACLAEKYWQTCSASGRQLAAILRQVRQREVERLSEVSRLPAARQLALEDENVRASLDYARTHFAGL